jgi:Fe-S oxidoreductase
MVGAGSHEMAEERARDLVGKLERFSPKTVITSCPHCIVWIREHVKYFQPYSFEIQDYYAFISENLDSIGFKPVDMTVTVHDHCTLARPVDRSGYLRQILKAIPDVKIIEMNRIGSNSPCCGENLPHELNWLGKEMRRERLNEASRTGARQLLTACPACDHNYSIEAVDYPITVRNIMHLLTESIGLQQYQNKLEHFRSYHNIDRVLNEAEDTIHENGYSAKELREPLSYYLWGMRE